MVANWVYVNKFNELRMSFLKFSQCKCHMKKTVKFMKQFSVKSILIFRHDSKSKNRIGLKFSSSIKNY